MELCNPSGLVVFILDRLAYTLAGAFVGVVVEWRWHTLDRLLWWVGERTWTQSGPE